MQLVGRHINLTSSLVGEGEVLYVGSQLLEDCFRGVG